MPPPSAPAPDYSAAWAAYYQQQAAAAVGAQVGGRPPAQAPYAQPTAPAMGAYGSFVPQAPYGGMPGYPGASQPAYLGLPPMGIQPRPPTYAQPAPQQAYTPSVGPQAYPSARPMQAPQTPQPQPMGGYSPYAPGAGGFGGARPPPAGPQAMPMRPPSAASSHHPMGGMGPQQPMGMLHPSPNQGFPPAKRPRFDSGPQQPLAGPGGGAGPASRTISIPSSAGLPSNPMTIATPMSMVAGPSSSSTGGGGGGGGGNDFFSGSDGRDHGSMPRGPGGRGGSNSVRGGPKGMRGGFGYEDDGYGSVNGFRGKPRGIMRASPPPNGPTGPRNSGQSSSRSERGAFKGRGRGAFSGGQQRDLPDAPRGPAATRAGRQPKESSTPTQAQQDKSRPKEKEDKKTLSDFKIVGLEVPELEWKWGLVPERERERDDEAEGSGGRKRKAEGGDDDDGPSSPSASASGPSQKQQRGSYFMTHGKENTSKAEQVTRDVNRLRIYFDSPAGQGHGEKRGRGGIEGLRAPPPVALPAAPAPPTGPKAMLAKKEAKASAEPTQPGAASEPCPSKEDSVDGVISTADADQYVEQAGLKEEPASDITAATAADVADVELPLEHVSTEAPDATKSEAEADVEGLLASLTEDTVVAEAGPAPEESVDDAAGDVSMLSARGSVEPENKPAASDQSAAADAAGVTETSTTTASTEPASNIGSPIKKERDVSVVPGVSEAGAAASVHATPARETGDVDLYYRGPEPSDDRISILYERSTRRICIDADVIERVRISRTKGKIELTVRWNKSADPSADPLANGGEKRIESAGNDAAEPVADGITGGQESPVEGAPIQHEAATADAVLANDTTQEDAAADVPAVSAPVDDSAAAPDLSTDRVKIEDTTDGSSTIVPPATETSGPDGAEMTEEGRSQNWDICRGVLMEQLDEETDMFQPVTFETLDDMWEGVSDPSAGWTPPVHKLIAADSDPAAPYPSLRCETFKIVAYLDQDRPLSEPKWVRTGHVEDWLNDLFGRMKVGNKKVSSWRGKFEILDPEPAPLAPTIQNSLDSWATNSTAGSAKERRRFVKQHLSEMDNIFEILLRLTRGDRTAGTGPATPSSLVGPLATAASPNSHYAAKQNHVSLAVLAMLRLTYELAEKAGVPSTEVNDRVSEIIRAIPSHLLFKSVDGIFRDHLADKKH